MINNQTGTIIAMTHILLPFMILPLYSVMKTISPSYVRAAKSLGANDWTAFWRVYFPQSFRASAPARSSSSSCRSATTSRRNWSAARPASSSRTGSPTTSRRR
jgi:ABC-type amino acid transport system permease subunit